MGEQQKQRQKDLLKQQKLRRQQDQDDSRPLQKPGEKPPKTKKNWKRAGHQKGIPYRPQLSEWLRHKPEDLGEWLLVPCPVGKRCLVVASKGITKAYSKGGWMFMDLRSSLPGDSPACCMFLCTRSINLSTDRWATGIIWYVPLLPDFTNPSSVSS